MTVIQIEHSKWAYRADFVLYAAALVALTAHLLSASPMTHALEIPGLVALGLVAWTALEYGLHRFVLHGLAPFSEWHEEHHRRPLALLGTPTLISALLFVCLIYLPLRVLAGEWRASALMLGLLTGYLGYATIHHALHHWHSQHAWFRRRQRWHARHHHVRPLTNYGVSTNVWDRLLHAPE